MRYIAGSVSATNDEATWVLTSYLVANAVVLPASGWFAIRFGRKRFLIVCIMIFTASSFFCGAATSLGFILIARAVQGAGGGALQPLSQAILLESFPPEKRGMAMSVFALGVVVAPVLGPTLGGWLTESYSWRWAFYINIPFGILAVLLILRFVEDPPYIKKAIAGKFDGLGLGLLAVWLGALQIILDKGQEDDWFGATWIRWAAAILVVALVAFLIREFTQDKPLVRLEVFRNRNFAVGCILIFLFGGVVYGLVTILPLFFQELMGYTALAAGLAVAPRGVGALLFMPVIGILTAKVDNRYLAFCGFAFVGICTLWMGNATLDISQWSLLWPIILTGAGMSLIFVPLATITMGTLPNEEIGNVSGLYNLMRNVGGSVGISVVIRCWHGMSSCIATKWPIPSRVPVIRSSSSIRAWWHISRSSRTCRMRPARPTKCWKARLIASQPYGPMSMTSGTWHSCASPVPLSLLPCRRFAGAGDPVEHIEQQLSIVKAPIRRGAVYCEKPG